MLELRLVNKSIHAFRAINPPSTGITAPVTMDVNSSLGLKGTETGTGKDIAGMIIDFIAANAKAGNTKTKGKG